VDLVYLDLAPFNSNADYSIFVEERDWTRAAAEIKAFEDTPEWNDDFARRVSAVLAKLPKETSR
jgi:hypothetical protein